MTKVPSLLDVFILEKLSSLFLAYTTMELHMRIVWYGQTRPVPASLAVHFLRSYKNNSTSETLVVRS